MQHFKVYRLRIQAFCFVSCSFGAEAWRNRRAMSCLWSLAGGKCQRVQKGGFIVHVLSRYNLGPNVVLEPLELHAYCPSVPSCPSRRRHRRPLSVHPVGRPVVVVRPLSSVRPSTSVPSSSVLCPSNSYLNDVA